MFHELLSKTKYITNPSVLEAEPWDFIVFVFALLPSKLLITSKMWHFKSVIFYVSISVTLWIQLVWDDKAIKVEKRVKWYLNWVALWGKQ